jgi:hypothetical protein
MPLTDTAIRKAKSKEKPFKISDSGGLYLLVQPSGSKWWRYKYRFAGKEKLLALGSYPETSLAEARERHLQARKTLAAGNLRAGCGAHCRCYGRIFSKLQSRSRCSPPNHNSKQIGFAIINELNGGILFYCS